MKRILAFGLAILLILGLLPISTLAETAVPAFVLTGGKAQQGDTVQVTLSTKNNPGIVSLKVMVGYDSSVLSLTAVEGQDFADVSFGPLTKNPIAVNWMNSVEPNNTTNGVVAVLTFQVLNTAADGETAVTATYNPNDVFDFDMNNVAFGVVNGVVTIGCIHKETTTVSAVGSTCVLQGHGAYTYCNDCGEVLEGNKDLLPLGDHTFTGEVVADEYKVSDATCVNSAVYFHSCALCGEVGETTFTVGEVDASNHSGDVIVVPAQDSTCLEQGHSEYSYCDHCNEVVEGSDELLPFAPHTCTAQVVADKYKVSDATCVEKAVYYHSCTLCGEVGETTFTVGDVDASHHSGTIVVVPAKASTCLEQGHNEYSYCDDCNEVVEGSDELLPFGNHKMDALVEKDEYLKSPAYCNTVAIYYYSCSLCGEKGDKTFAGSGTIDRTNHEGKEMLNNKQDPTYDAPGYTGDVICDACGTVLVPGQVIPQLQKPSGLVQDGDVYRYLIDGVAQSGWFEIDGNWYYFHKDTLAAKAGTFKLNGVYFEFEETGKLTSGVWGNAFTGWRYYYGPDYYRNGWYQIDSAWYYFQDGYRVEGQQQVINRETGSGKAWYEFDETGVCQGLMNGIYLLNGEYYYIENGLGTEKYLICVDGDYYYATYGGKLAVNKTITTLATNCDLPKGKYTFGADGKMLGASAEGEILELDGVLYYYENGVGVEKGLFEYNGDYYYSAYQGKLVVNRILNTPFTSCDLPNGRYEFGADGKMIQGIIERDGALYYYENGVGVEKGLFKFEGDYYYSAYQGKLVVNKVLNTPLTSCDLPNGFYEFGADGKMIQGIIERDGNLYYYENGRGVEKGLFKFNGDYYYSAYQGKLVVNKLLNTPLTSCDLPNGFYEFGADGKMIQGIIERDGNLYYYENGRGVEKGLFEYNGDYYYSVYEGKLVVNKALIAPISSCDLPIGQRYEFGADGKMIQGIIERDGVLYYYENGQGVEKGLFEYNGDYYYSAYQGKLVVNKVLSAPVSSCDLPIGRRYEFGADGKMLNGIVERDGVLYYYENGQGVEKGLFKYNGDYYYSAYQGKLVVNKVLSAPVSSCDLPIGRRYEFGADGKMLNGIVEKDGVLYYYENGQGVEKGLFYLDGYYYYSVYQGKLAVNKTINIAQGNGLLVEKAYTFNELGQIIG